MKKIRIFMISLSFIALLSIIFAAVPAADAPTPFFAKLSEDGIQRIEIKLDNYSYDPNYIVVVVNKPVELTLKNVAKIVPHNFTINQPEAGINVNENVQPGKEAKVSFTPTKTGTFDFFCGVSGIFGSHKKKGMVGTLSVVETMVPEAGIEPAQK